MPSISPTARYSELDAVNAVLTNIGQSPVNSLTDSSVDIGMAVRVLGNSSRELQLRGWSFNVDEEYTLTSNSDSKIPITDTMLAVEVDRFTYPKLDVVIRGSFLYNRYGNTYVFGSSIEAEVTWLLPWDELPPHAQNYITVTSALRMADDVEAGSLTHRFNQEDQMHAWNSFKSQEIDTNDANLVRIRRSAALRFRPRTTSYAN